MTRLNSKFNDFMSLNKVNSKFNDFMSLNSPFQDALIGFRSTTRSQHALKRDKRRKNTLQRALNSIKKNRILVI
jgi:hypothetical protein